jgi:hypothetical protein
MKKKIIETNYTTIRIHKKTAIYLEKMRMKNYSIFGDSTGQSKIGDFQC